MFGSSHRAQWNIPAHLWDSAGSSTLSHWGPVKLFNRSLRDLVDTKMKGLVVLVMLASLATAQHQALIDYLERRLLAIEVRLTLAPCRALGSKIPRRGNFQEQQGKGNGMQMWPKCSEKPLYLKENKWHTPQEECGICHGEKKIAF